MILSKGKGDFAMNKEKRLKELEAELEIQEKQLDLERERLASRLREYRKALKLTQEELANKLGKRQSVVSSWELGTGIPDANQLPAIAKALGVSVADICGSPDLNSFDKEILDAFHAADKITQNNIKLLLGITEKGEDHVEN